MDLAVLVKTERPDLYAAVTGRPVWADQVGREYQTAERKWRRWVERNVVPR